MPTEPIDLIARIKAIHAMSQVAQGKSGTLGDINATHFLWNAIEYGRWVRMANGDGAQRKQHASDMATQLRLAANNADDIAVRDAITGLLGDCLLAAMTANA